MNCSYKGVFENTISSAGYDNNYGFDGPYSNAYSLNSRVGRLTAGILPDLYKPDIEGPSTVSGIHASYDRLFYNNGNYDGQYAAGLASQSAQPIAEANAELATVAPEAQAELPPPSNAPEPTDLTPSERAVITQQAVADENSGTVAVDVLPNPPETIKEQESFIFGGRRRFNRVLNKQLPVTNGQYVAASRRTNPNRERFTHNEISGFRDSQYLHEAFLDTKQEQDQSNAIALVVLTVCLFVITIIILWNTFGSCSSGDNGFSRRPVNFRSAPAKPFAPAAPVQPIQPAPAPIQPAQPIQQPAPIENPIPEGFSGGYTSKLSGSIF